MTNNWEANFEKNKNQIDALNRLTAEVFNLADEIRNSIDNPAVSNDCADLLEQAANILLEEVPDG